MPGYFLVSGCEEKILGCILDKPEKMLPGMLKSAVMTISEFLCASVSK